jgi:DNA (cytosine-5)-methyltransferase 1
VRKNAHDHPPRLRYGSVCSGIEAASVAWHPFGWSASFLSEIDPFPRAVLKHRFPGVPLHGDFTTIATGQYDAIDLLVGGTPCQSFSIAGLRKGMADTRGNLALEYLRLADRLRPRWLVWENVPGVLSSNGGRDFGSFLGGLGVLGYGFAYRVLDAQYFGLAQRRKRVFVVGYLGDWRCAAAVLFEPDSLRGHPAPRRETRQRVASTVALGSPGGRVYGLDADTADSLVPMAFGGNNVSGPIDVATALTAHGGPMGRMDFESETFITGTLLSNGKAAGSATNQDAENGFLIAHTLRGEGFDASEDGTGRGTPIVPCPIPFDTTQITSWLNRSAPQAGDPCHPLTAGGHLPAIAFHGSQDPCVSGDVTCSVGRNRGLETCMLSGLAARRLTPRECERLQGFPDDYTLIPWRKGVAPDGPRYKALGNSMAVPVMAFIGRRIQMVENLMSENIAAVEAQQLTAGKYYSRGETT